MKEDKLIAIFSKYDFDDNYTEEQAILSAMKEAMREESIGFAEWVTNHGWEFYEQIGETRIWRNSLKVIENKNSDQLYNEYLKN